MPSDPPQLSAVQVFTLLFVMLGPLKFLGPFVAGTRSLDDAAVRSLAVKATIMATITVIAGAFVGKTMMQNMGISLPALDRFPQAIWARLVARRARTLRPPSSTLPDV